MGRPSLRASYAPAVDGTEVVRRYWEGVWGGGELDLVDELFADPYVRHNRNGTEVLTRARIKQDLVQYWRSLRNAEVTVDDLVAAGDRVWSRVTVRGVGEDSDRHVVTFLQQARIVDGRYAESWSLAAPDVDWSRF